MAGPAPRELLEARQRMIDSGDVRMECRDYFLGVQQRLVPLREPDLEAFSPPELAIVDDVVSEFRGYNATQITAFSHQEWG